MTLTLDDVQKIAHLARLALTSEEAAHYREQLAAVLDYAARLDELDLSDFAPAAAVMRDDIVTPSLPRDDALFNAAATAEGQFLIQPVLGE